MTDVDLEQRLRRALAARARAVTAQDLRPVVSARRATVVRWWLPLSAGLAAAAVLALIFVVFHRPDSGEGPIAPAASVPASGSSRSASAAPEPTASVSATVAPVPSTGPAGATPARLPTDRVVPGSSAVPATARRSR